MHQGKRINSKGGPRSKSCTNTMITVREFSDSAVSRQFENHQKPAADQNGAIPELVKFQAFMVTKNHNLSPFTIQLADG